MGVFDIGFVCPHGTLVRGQIIRPQVCPNHLMYRSHDRVLRKIMPSQSGSLQWEIGFSGPQYRGQTERPNFDSDTFTFDARGKYTDFVSGWASEGGAVDDEIRELFGYERQAVTPWYVNQDGNGTIISTGWHSWRNRVTWRRHGDWTPGDWDPEESGNYPQPSEWTDCPPYEDQDQGFPWCTPRIHDDWWEENTFNVECTSCVGHDAWTISHYPVGMAFVIVKKSGLPPEVFAAAEFVGPAFFRMGSRLVCRYRGRFG